MRQWLFSYSVSMLVRCPKCHFEQPKDPFCAKCGIEMSTFKPPADSLLGKIVKNATAVFFIVIIGLFTGTFFFYKSTKQELQDNEGKKSNLFKRQYNNGIQTGDVSNIEVTGAVKPDGTQASGPPPPVEQKMAGSKDIKDQSPEEIRQHLENQLFKKDSASKDAGAVTSGHYELHVYYAEVSSKGLDMLQQEARANGQSVSSDFAQGVINLPMTKVLSYRDEFSVYSELSKHLEKNKASDWFQGLKSAGPDSDIGITQSVLVKDSPNGRMQLEIKITKKFQGSPNDPSQKGFQVTDYVGSGEMEKEQTYFMSEILSKYPMSSQQEYLTAMSPFEIYKSQNFTGGKTFSVFFYTIENK